MNPKTITNRHDGGGWPLGYHSPNRRLSLGTCVLTQPFPLATPSAFTAADASAPHFEIRKTESDPFLPGAVGPLIPVSIVLFKDEAPSGLMIPPAKHVLNTYHGWALSCGQG